MFAIRAFLNSTLVLAFMSSLVVAVAASGPAFDTANDTTKPAEYAQLLGIVIASSGVPQDQFKLMHTGRNSNQLLRPNYSRIVADPNFIKLPDEKAVFHQIGEGNETNEKWVNRQTGEEYVFKNAPATPRLVADGVNDGTFNYRPDTDLVGHFFLDVLPYIVWGNNALDTTSVDFRLCLFEAETAKLVSKSNHLMEEDIKPADIALKISYLVRQTFNSFAQKRGDAGIVPVSNDGTPTEAAPALIRAIKHFMDMSKWQPTKQQLPCSLN